MRADILITAQIRILVSEEKHISKDLFFPPRVLTKMSEAARHLRRGDKFRFPTDFGRKEILFS